MKKVYWEVPHYAQERSMTCGLACVRMLLDFYGYKVSEDEILAETYMHKMGSWYSDLAKPFIERGLKTKIYTINLNIYSPFWAGENVEKLKKRLSKRKEELKGLLKTEVERMLQYLDSGGELALEIPDVEVLRNLIRKQPLIIPINRSFIYRDRIDDAGHYVVVNGFDGDSYTVLDPAQGSPNGFEYQVKKEVLEYAWLANNRDSDGYLLEII